MTQKGASAREWDNVVDSPAQPVAAPQAPTVAQMGARMKGDMICQKI